MRFLTGTKAAQEKRSIRMKKLLRWSAERPTGRKGCVDGCGERSKCKWHGNPGQRDDEPYIADDGAAALNAKGAAVSKED